MITTALDIMALVEQVRESGIAAEAAHQRIQPAREALKAAEDASCVATKNFRKAQHALTVAAGGTDMSFIWDL